MTEHTLTTEQLLELMRESVFIGYRLAGGDKSGKGRALLSMPFIRRDIDADLTALIEKETGVKPL